MKDPISKKYTIKLNGFFAVFCLLMFVYVFLIFSSWGAFGSEHQYPRGELLVISNFLMLTFIFLKHRHLINSPWLLKLIVTWLLWASFTCILLLPYGMHEFMQGLMVLLYAPLFFIVFYIFTKRRPAISGQMIFVFMVLLVVVSVLFAAVVRYLTGGILSFDPQVLNIVYYALFLLPWVLLCPNSFWRNAGIILIAGIVFWSFKRGAIIALALSLIVYFFSSNPLSIKKRLFFKQLMGTIAVLLVCFLLFTVVEYKTDGHLIHRLASVSEDRGSGRVEIYISVINAQLESSISEWFLGRGYDGVRRDLVHMRADGTAMSAHNDFLEILFNHGLPGLVLYTLFHLSLLWNTLKLIKARSAYAPPMAASYVIFFLTSMGSQPFLHPTYISYLMAFWGMIFAMQKQEKLPRNDYKKT